MTSFSALIQAIVSTPKIRGYGPPGSASCRNQTAHNGFPIGDFTNQKCNGSHYRDCSFDCLLMELGDVS